MDTFAHNNKVILLQKNGNKCSTTLPQSPINIVLSIWGSERRDRAGYILLPYLNINISYENPRAAIPVGEVETGFLQAAHNIPLRVLALAVRDIVPAGPTLTFKQIERVIQHKIVNPTGQGPKIVDR